MNSKTIAVLAVFITLLSGWLLLEIAAETEERAERFQRSGQVTEPSVQQDSATRVEPEEQQVGIGVNVQ